MRANTLVLCVALLLASAANLNFWSTLVHAVGGLSTARLPLLLGCFAIVALLLHLTRFAKGSTPTCAATSA